ncbi:protease complex subunit PrcB family protein [Fuchsiella alkaliacetigena]|uniref:protease complex subunit PrcB family protein n=1 Tax=Fuchsiella alkaliacetigena TaxID=957042 RepID=UPI00200A77A0|nr:protease complex subunit PrcB family protein [Fuchsiella alkaliacetigena]MCK8824056.1 protease complex subunit PrcB family protein [Fuchsiella alkaliacetigena]
MKKQWLFLALCLVLFTSILVVGYAKEDISIAAKDEVELEFEVIEKLPEDLKKAIGFVGELRGFGVIRSTDNESIIYIGVGEKPTGGYGIEVESVKEVDGLTKIKVVETSPAADQLVTQAITYPRVVIKVKDITDDIQVINEQGEVFEDINDETKEAEYIDSKTGK